MIINIITIYRYNILKKNLKKMFICQYLVKQFTLNNVFITISNTPVSLSSVLRYLPQGTYRYDNLYYKPKLIKRTTMCYKF